MQRHTSRIGHPVTKVMMRWVGLMALILGLHSPTAWAAERIKIQSLYTYPDAYMLKIVEVEGTVRNYRMERRFEGMCIHLFSVEDETGIYDASYWVICKTEPITLKDGDQVTIEGHFEGTKYCAPNARRCTSMASYFEGGTRMPLGVRSLRKH
jgi:hypothetical protein